MKTKILTIVLPVIALAFLISIAFAFKPKPSKQATTKNDESVVLAFRYKLTSAPTAAAAALQSNWERIDEEEMCNTTVDQIPCSFSISVSEDDASLYVNSSDEPTSRVSIQATQDISTSQYYVSDVHDTGQPGSPSIKQDINNRTKPL